MASGGIFPRWPWAGMFKVPKILSFQYICNISKIEVRDKYFLHTDKHQTSLQFDPINLGAYCQAFPNYPI